MKITVLGCGGSGGVPLIGNDWGDCDPQEPKNRRLRPSILVQQDNTTILVDTTPDMRQQLLNADVKDMTAILYTHAHADHTHGFDDIRYLNTLLQKPIDVWADAATGTELRHRFAYAFQHREPEKFYRPTVALNEINGPFTVGDVKIIPFRQDHGLAGESRGFRFGDFAYSTDVRLLDEAAFNVLAGVKVWVVDGLREEAHPSHSHISQTLEWIARVKPERAFLTHMNERTDYRKTLARLPNGVEPAWDGLVISL